MACKITCKEIETVRKIGGEWKSSIFPPEQFRLKKVDSNSVVFIFAEADRVRECAACREHFKHTFQMPELWWFSWCRRANGYFGSEEKVDSDGRIEAHNTWFRFIAKALFYLQIMYDLKPGRTTLKGYIYQFVASYPIFAAGQS